jgi:hypothetical protein
MPDVDDETGTTEDEFDEMWDASEVSEYPGVVVEKRQPAKVDRWRVENKTVDADVTK